MGEMGSMGWGNGEMILASRIPRPLTALRRENERTNPTTGRG